MESLQGVLEELCSVDLTLSQAKVLRCRLFELVETLEGTRGEGDRSAAPWRWGAR